MIGKFKNKFTAMLALITVVGLSIGALADFGVINLNQYVGGITAILLGFGLMLEGNIRGILGIFTKNGSTDVPDIVHIISGLLGLFVFIGGIIMVMNITISAQLSGILGFAKSLAVVAVVMEYFL